MGSNPLAQNPLLSHTRCDFAESYIYEDYGSLSHFICGKQAAAVDWVEGFFAMIL